LINPPKWKAVLVQHLLPEGALPRARLRPVLPGDPVDASVASTSFKELALAIPDGIETRRLARFGFEYWGDLYTERQASILLSGLAAIQRLTFGQSVKDRLAFAVIGCTEMPAYLSRWDRFALKPFEALANHRYAHSTLAAEIDPLAPVGRGTLPRRFAAACKTLEWLSGQCGKLPALKRVVATSRKMSRQPNRVVVATGSSTRQPIPDGTVQLTLSDPPYLADVQYGELARLFHLWLGIYKPLAAIDENSEAVPNTARGIGVDAYRATIASCLGESRRALARNGRLVLTFHNTELVAWQALAGALHQAGFDVLALAVVHAENGGDLCKRNVNSMLHDLVLECRLRRRRASKPEVVVAAKSVAEKNLVAIGLALAQATRSGRPEVLPALYESELKRLKASRRTIQ
jgi:putative DNA methylase